MSTEDLGSLSWLAPTSALNTARVKVVMLVPIRVLAESELHVAKSKPLAYFERIQSYPSSVVDIQIAQTI